jgi:hypothetical protein
MVPNINGAGGVDLLQVNKSFLNPSNPATLINLFNLDRLLVSLRLAGATPEYCDTGSWVDAKINAPRLPGSRCFYQDVNHK